MKTTTRLLTLTAAAFAIGASGLVFAQQGNEGPDRQGSGMGMGPGMGQHAEGHRGGHHHHGKNRGGPSAAEMSAHLDKLKAELKITEAQAPVWQQFATTVQGQAEARQTRRTEMRAQMQASKASGAQIDRQALRTQMQQQHAAERTARNQARQALYAVLTPEQKALADTRMRGGERGERGERGDRQGGHHGEHRHGA
jgi:Spy/CpxP family protein refolding chaperone